MRQFKKLLNISCKMLKNVSQSLYDVNAASVHALLIDVVKAFDRVDHRLLCLKLASIGVCGQDLKWIESDLRCRRISTSVDRPRSRLHEISSGVPQGSVLCPLLFFILLPGSARLGVGYHLFIC